LPSILSKREIEGLGNRGDFRSSSRCPPGAGSGHQPPVDLGKRHIESNRGGFLPGEGARGDRFWPYGREVAGEVQNKNRLFPFQRLYQDLQAEFGREVLSEPARDVKRIEGKKAIALLDYKITSHYVVGEKGLAAEGGKEWPNTALQHAFPRDHPRGEGALHELITSGVAKVGKGKGQNFGSLTESQRKELCLAPPRRKREGLKPRKLKTGFSQMVVERNTAGDKDASGICN